MLRRLPSLTHLDLRDNLISHINAADSFAEVPLLTELLLAGNQMSHTVEDTAAAPFKHLKHLELLGLASNSIRSVGDQVLLGQEALHTLILNSSSLLCDCKLRLRPQYALFNNLQDVTAECTHPKGLKGEQVVNIQPELFTC